jgi:hypothetical protein
MGRGRAKAKQTKVARALKYGGPQTDLERLQAELAGSGSPAATGDVTDDVAEAADDIDADDDYAQYYPDDDDRQAG